MVEIFNKKIQNPHDTKPSGDGLEVKKLWAKK